MRNITYPLFLLPIILLFSLFQRSYAQSTTTQKGNGNVTAKWSSNPFDHQVFIENKGQFDLALGEKGKDKILFAAQIGDIYAYITKHGIIYKYEEHPELHPEKGKDGLQKKIDPDEMGAIKHTPHYLTATWENSNDGALMTTGDAQTYYYTYPVSPKGGTIKAAIYKKITCTNVYPGIDIEYVFPKDKGGIKYTIVVHPGADISAAKLQYEGAEKMKLDLDGNVRINTGWGKFEDHAPVTYYEDESYSPIESGYNLKDDEESFYAKDVDPTKTLMIDPWSINWTQNPNFVSTSGFDGAYDVDFDYAGNVYVYGGWSPFQLVQYNSAGVKQWVYNTSNFPNLYYGDFCVDKVSGISFALEGFGASSGAITDKISPSGALLGTCSGNSSLDEQWRATYDLCDHIILIAGGGTTSSNQAATLDTNLTTYTIANVLQLPPSTAYHDFALIATDPLLPVGYMATTWTYANTSLDNNVLLQMPLPAMMVPTYTVSDGYNFQECNSVAYVGPGNYIGAKTTNGMNGMAASPNWLYMYDGLNLNQVIKANGTLNATTNLGGTSYDWGGLDVDLCDDIYVGYQTNVQVRNSSLALTNTIGPFPGNVYDVVLGNGVLGFLDSTMYVCGNGFVSSVKISPPHPPTIAKVKHQVCSCNCTAKATLMICGNPDTVGVTYAWSNGQTTETATGLCPGNTYSVTITLGCDAIFSDTVIFSNSGSLTITKASTNATCITPGTASVSVAGGKQPYTYSWSNDGTTTSSVGGLGAGNICVSIEDSAGCQDSVCFIIAGVGLPTITITPNPDSICLGSSTALLAAGGVSYTWLPVTGLSCNSCPNPTASPTATITYTVTGTDANGCKNKDSVVVKVFPPPVITVTPANDSICIGNSVGLTAAGAVSYTWSPSTGLSCNNCVNPTANPTVTTSYLVTGTDVNGCTGTANVTVNVASLPTISLSASSTSICIGGSVTMNASSTAISKPYLWQPGAMTGPTVVVSPSVTTTYTVTGSNACDTVSQTITITVNPLPLPSFAADVRQGCSPLCIQFRDLSTVTTGRISSWTWTFGDGDSLKTENPIYCYPNPGTYNVALTITSDSGCSSTLKIANMITVYSHPVASFSLSPQPTNILSPTIQFTDKSTDDYGIAFWNWTFGDYDTVVTIENPSHTYGDTGTYCARLVVMNIHGCTDTAINCLIIDPIFCLYIPDAFTPNGDGKNDVFLVKGNDIKTFEMYIFDRWGMQLFHSTDIMNGWNGTVNGGNMVSQEDTYVYMIKVTDHKDKRHTYTGKLNLIK